MLRTARFSQNIPSQKTHTKNTGTERTNHITTNKNQSQKGNVHSAAGTTPHSPVPRRVSGRQGARRTRTVHSSSETPKERAFFFPDKRGKEIMGQISKARLNCRRSAGQVMTLATLPGRRPQTHRPRAWRTATSRTAAMDHRLSRVLHHPSPSLGPPPLLPAAVTSATVVVVVVEGGAAVAATAQRQPPCPPRSSSLLVLLTPWPSPPSTPRTGGRLAAAGACTSTARARTSLVRRTGETMPSTSTVPLHLVASLRTPG